MPGSYETNSQGRYLGTLVTAAIRPNDPFIPISTAYSNEILGGLHNATSSTDRDNIINARRDWGMMCYVIDEDKTYQLKYNYVDNDIMNNSNWVEFSGSGGGGSNEWLDSVISIELQPPVTYSVGDRYLAGINNNQSLLGDWVSFSPGSVLEWNSVSWVLTEPTNGTSIRVDNEDNSIYRYEGNFPTGAWYKEALGQIRSIDATSVNNQNYIASSTPPFDAYVKDMLFLTKFNSINSGATASININSLGSVPIRKPSPTGLVNLVAGDIVPDITYSLVYNGSVFELIKHYTGDSALNIRYYIEPSVHVVVPPYHQYWVYGNLTIDGQMTNYGQVIIANGSLINSNNFFNFGTLSFIQFNAGTASPTSNLSVGDFDANLTFPNITSIKFRGGSVTTPTGPADSVRVTGDVPNEVIVWIPAPSYVDNFSLSATSTTLRDIAEPVSNNYNVGNWSPSNLGSKRTVNTTTLTYTNTEFSLYNQSTTMDFIVYDHVGATVSSIEGYVLSGNGSTQSTGITLTVSNYGSDSDRFKAGVQFVVDLSTLFTQGGRFSLLMRHNNSTEGVYTFTDSDIFYDSDGSSSSAVISGPVTIQERSIGSIVYRSGIAYYNVGDTFTFSAFGIDNINDRSYPRGTTLNTSNSTGQQLRLVTSNLAISTTFWGYTNNPNPVNTTSNKTSQLQGWNNTYNISGLTYSVSGSINVTGQKIPDLNSSNNLNTTVLSTITANLIDWSSLSGSNSSSFPCLIDTTSYNYLQDNSPTTPSSSFFISDPVGIETKRLSMSQLGTDGSWISNISLPDDSLQVAFDTIIYPRENYSTYYPSVNLSNGFNYSSLLSPPSKIFNIYTNITTGQIASSNQTFNDYRWYATNFYRNGGLSNSYKLSFESSNISENDFNWIKGLNNNTGSGDVVILVGIDDVNLGSLAQSPTKYLFLTGGVGRVNGSGANFDSAPREIQFSFGGVGSFQKIWLLIGFKNGQTNNKSISDITLSIP